MTRRVTLIVDSIHQLGPQWPMVELAQTLPEFGVHCRFVVLNGRAEEIDDLRADIPSVMPCTCSAKRFDFSVRDDLSALIRSFQSDVVHVSGSLAAFYGRIAAKRAGNVPVIETTGGHHQSATKGARLFEYFVGAAQPRRVGSVVDPSDNGSATGNSHTIPLGQPIDVEQFREQSAAEWFVQFGIEPGTRVIGTVASHTNTAGLKTNIWASDLISLIRDDTMLVIIGDGPVRRLLERYARLIQTYDKIRFTGWHPQTRTLVANLDCYWYPDDSYSTESAARFASAAGVPIVAPETAAHQRICFDGVNALLYRPNARDQLAQKTNLILSDDAVREDLAQGGCKVASRWLSAREIASRYIDLYEQAGIPA